MKKDTTKSTMLVITTGFLILYIVFSWDFAVIISLIAGIIGITSETLSKIIESGWMKLARVLSYIIPTILLGIVFYLILFPVSLISKLFTQDTLMLSGKYKSYFVNIDKKLDKQSFEKIW